MLQSLRVQRDALVRNGDSHEPTELMAVRRASPLILTKRKWSQFQRVTRHQEDQNGRTGRDQDVVTRHTLWKTYSTAIPERQAPATSLHRGCYGIVATPVTRPHAILLPK
ncbi:hypothetical protein E4U44_008204 [Claviceps purpurea]|nr:hypothetical protein E4U44_008204 [Claviceps purpurea]